MKGLLNINPILLSKTEVSLLYFKCKQGHITKCKTNMRQYYCKECDSILQKKDCDRFTDSKVAVGSYKKSKKIEHNGKVLYQFPESFRRNYHLKKQVGLFFDH